jgi:hypothetical protein
MLLESAQWQSHLSEAKRVGSERAERGWDYDDGSEQIATIRAISGAMKDLRLKAPSVHRRLCALLSASALHNLDGSDWLKTTIDFLADRLPARVRLPVSATKHAAAIGSRMAEELDDRRWLEHDYPEEDDDAPEDGEDVSYRPYTAADIFYENGADEEGAIGAHLEASPGGKLLDAYVPSAAPSGRQIVGTGDPERAAELICDRINAPLQTIRRALAPGRPSSGAREVRDAVTRVVFEIRRDNLATPDALAEALSCNRRTISRMCRQHAEPVLS